jgi:hypothetical protein
VHPVIALALVMVAGLAATRLPRLRTLPPPLDFILLAGLHLLLLGVLLGPVSGVLDAPTLQALAPLTALGIGWLGARFGARFEWRWIRHVPRGVWALALVETAAALLVTILAVVMLARVPAFRASWPGGRLPLMLALAAIAIVAAPDLIALTARQVGAAPRLLRHLRAAATLATACGVLLFALALGARRLGAAGGLPVALGTGVVVAALLVVIGRLLYTPEDLTVPLLGIVLLGAGVGVAGGASPFLVCAIASALAAPFLPRRRVVARRLATWERPILGVFLILTGAVLGLPTLWVLPAALVFFIVRAAARWAAVRYGRRVMNPLAAYPPDAGLASIAQGGVAVALAMGWYLVRGPGVAGLLTMVIVMVALSWVAARPCMARAVRPRDL